MKYDVQTIREQFRQGARMSFILFWGTRGKVLASMRPVLANGIRRRSARMA